MNITAKQHGRDHLLLICIEPTGYWLAMSWVAMGAKQHVKNRERIIVLMAVALVMDPMHFRPLDQVAEPMRSLDIHVSEIVIRTLDRGEPDNRLPRKAEHCPQESRTQEHVACGVQRVRVGRGQSLNALRAVV